MKKLLVVLAALMLLCGAACAEGTAFAPIPWDTEVSPNLPDPDCFLPDNAGYHDDSLDISIEMTRDYDTDIMIMHVTLTDVSQFRTATAAKYPSKNTVAVKRMTKKVNAVAGVSSDYFNYHDDAVVVRNGVVLRDRFKAENPGSRAGRFRDLLVVDKNGDLHIFVSPSDEAWRAYDQEQALHVFCYGPGLVVDGEMLTDIDGVRLSCGKNKRTQRMAIAQTGPLTYDFIATEGPENKGSKGLTLAMMAEFCAGRGYQNCYNLDGGSSETIVLNNRKINSLSSGKERNVGDCIWFATLVPSN